MRKALLIPVLAAFVLGVFLIPSSHHIDAQSTPDVTLNDTVYWDAVVGSTKYEVRILTSGNGPFWPDNANSNIVHDNGTDTFFALSQALNGAAVAEYKFQVRAQSPATAWSQLTINYVGLSPPTNLRLTP